MFHKTAKFGMAAIVVGLVSSFSMSDPASAISRGAKTPDGMTCRVLFGHPHMHKGRAGRRASYAEARSSAIKRWIGFTAWEYGSKWANFGLARGKSWDCRKAHRGGWKCKVKAQPCHW